MATAAVIPVDAATLETHAELDNAAHAEIAQTEDEDYKWLTDRLDAHSSELGTLRSQVSELSGMVAALRELLSSNQEQSRTVIETLTRLNENLTTNLTNLSAVALESSRLTPTNSENSSETTPETVTETVTEVTPENVSAEHTPAVPARRKLRRM